jgi:type I restriction enzyme S subunit
MSKWPSQPLASAIQCRKEFVQIDDLQQYKRCRVQLHAQGIVLRDSVPGAEIKTKKQQVCKTGDFLVAEIDAKVGGFGIVPEELDQAIVSSHYFLFEVNEKVLNRRFLDFFIRTPAFREQVAAQGSTNYAAIRPNDVLGYKLPLPPLPEQQRIVARIESLATKIEEARSLREEVQKDLSRLLNAAYHQIADKAPRKPLGALAPLDRRPVTVDFEANYPSVAVRSFGRGTFHKPPLIGSEVTWEKPFLVKVGDILVSNIKAWEGAIAVAGADDDGRVGSHRYLTCVAKPGIATARFVCFHLLTSEGLYEVGEASPGSADRNRTLSAKAFMQIPIPMPEYGKQVWFDALYQKVDSIAKTQSESSTELAALLPSILDKAFKGEM